MAKNILDRGNGGGPLSEGEQGTDAGLVTQEVHHAGHQRMGPGLGLDLSARGVLGGFDRSLRLIAVAVCLVELHTETYPDTFLASLFRCVGWGHCLCKNKHQREKKRNGFE